VSISGARDDQEILSAWQRGPELVFVVLMLLLFGFFTERFGPLEMLCL
jgi:hypothetical protein